MNAKHLYFLGLVLALGIPAAFAQTTSVSKLDSKTTEVPTGEHRKVEGVIVSRDGDNLVLRLTPAVANVSVKVTSFTQIREKKFNPFRKSRRYQPSQLTPGLTVDVEGHGDSDGALVADKIVFTNDDFKLARSVDARVSPVEENERKMSGQIDELGAVSNSARGGAKAAQETADKAHERISNLDDYKTVSSTTVHFKVGSALLSEDAKKSLDELVQQSKDLKGFVIEVAGFASSEGNAAFNQRLSRQRAEAVVEYLTEQHDIPLRRIMIPTGYGVTHPVARNNTRNGRQENRRVEVRILVSRGIAVQASANPS
ncbi:MAG TPA: OmpA family protein [Acidobacteriota bacterium]|nr:OmpA family protein [Acidobacteriota bacterium]